MEPERPHDSNQSLLIAAGVIAVAALAAWLFFSRTPEGPTPEEVAQSADIISRAAEAPAFAVPTAENPIRQILPAENPIERTNPFNDAYVNPFAE